MSPGLCVHVSVHVCEFARLYVSACVDVLYVCVDRFSRPRQRSNTWLEATHANKQRKTLLEACDLLRAS